MVSTLHYKNILILSGSMGVDKWRKKEWQSHFDEHQLWVLTPSIFVDILQAQYIRFDQVHLIVFDECHHARKNDPYSQIVQLYRFHTPIETRPKLFGMTAVSNKRKLI